VPNDLAHPAPVVIFFYGGGWESGSKDDYLFVGQGLAANGFVVVIADYPLYPEVRYPAFLQDSAEAVRWTADHAAGLGGDKRRIYIVGHSAGAYIAAMLVLDREWLGAVGLDPRRDIRAMVGLAGPYHFLPLHSNTLKDIFGPESRRPLTQPIHYVDGDAPPMLLVTGDADKTADPGNSARLAQRILEKGGVVVQKRYAGISHIPLVGALAPPLHFLAPTLDDTLQFIHDHP